MENKLKMVSNWFTAEHDLNIVQSQKRPCKKLFTVKVEQLQKFYVKIYESLIGQKKSIMSFDLKMCKRGGVLDKSGYLTSCTSPKFYYIFSSKSKLKFVSLYV